MASFDDLDAPQFSNFDDYDQEEAEQYFEIDHESEKLKTPTKNEGEVSQEENYFSPMNANSTSDDRKQYLELRNRQVRRSSSCNNIQVPSKALSNLCLNDAEQTTETNVKIVKKFEYGVLRKATSGSQSKLRFCSQESLNRLAAPKKMHSSNGNIAQASGEYVSVAEAVRKFHEKTPNRFHSQNKKTAAPKNDMPIKLRATIPMSPRLLTKRRVKTTEPVMSYEQRMQMEFENQQKFKVKAHPVNKKILQPMKAVHVEKKPITVPEPFKLTKIDTKKTVSSPKKEEYQFHAKTVPKSVVEPPKLPKKKEIELTVPVTPTFVKKLAKVPPTKEEVKKSTAHPLRNTRPEPFSFEKRNLSMMQKKQEKIKKIMEEEKKAREFHARPIPKPIISLITKQKQKSLDGSSSSLNAHDHCKEEHVEKFKARPPKVLYQKPFEPKKLEQPLIEIQPFTLNSDLRAREREMFERKKKELEELASSLLKQEEEENLRKEEEERKRLREETKFKAQPIRNFKGVIIQPSGKVTEPISPVFLSGKSNRKNKENEL